MVKLHRLLVLIYLTFICWQLTHAALSPENYWKTKLPDTPMPKSLRGFLHQLGGKKSWSNSEIISQGGVGAYYHYASHSPHRINPDGKHNYNYGGNSRVVPNSFYGGKRSNIFQLNRNNLTLYFLEKDLLYPGKIVKLNLTKMAYLVSFQSREVSESIPFSSNKLAEIFNTLSVKPGSREAEIITQTLEICEGPGIKGEDKYCATSLESMIDFTISKLGENPQAISTETNYQTHYRVEKYKITDGLKKASGDKTVVCHVQSYAYAVFYCHELKATSAYRVPLVGVNGSTLDVKSVAVCHKDTSGWNPQHLAFQLLDVKPGDGNSICHILNEGNIVWVPRH